MIKFLFKNLFKKSVILSMTILLVATELPTRIVIAEESSSDQTQSESVVLNNEENEQVEEVVVQEEVIEQETTEEAVVEEQQIEEEIQESIDEETIQEVNEEIIEESLLSTEENIEEEIPSLESLPKMLMSAPLVTSGSYPTYSVQYKKSDSFKLKDKVNKTILGVEKIEYTSGSDSIALIESYMSDASYYIRYKGISLGSVTAKITYRYSLTKTSTYTITVNVTKADLPDDGWEYQKSISETGGNVTNTVTNSNLTSDDFEVDGNIASDVGDYSITITGKNNYQGTKTLNWSISPSNDLKFASVTLDNNNITYDGNEHKVLPTVKVGETTLDKDTHYSLSYSSTDCKDVGTYKVNVIGIGVSGYVGSKEISYNIIQANSSFVDASAISNLIYSGENQKLVNIQGNANQEIQYHITQDKYNSIAEKSIFYTTVKDSNEKWSTSCTAKDAGTYYVYYRIKGNNNYTGINASLDNVITATISPKSITNSTVTFANDTNILTYNGSSQFPSFTLIDNGLSSENKVVDSSNYEISGDSKADPGDYYFSINGKQNYEGTIQDVAWKIEETNNFINATVSYSPTTFTYNGQVQKPTSFTVSINGKTLDSSEYNVSYANANSTEVGDYEITFSSTKYDGTKTFYYHIEKSTNNSADIKGINNLTYNGSAQQLVEVTESPKHGQIEYLLRESETSDPSSKDGWSTNIPTATNAGTYFVYYRVQGSNNYSGYGGTFAHVRIVTIAKYQLTSNNFVLAVDGKNITNPGSSDTVYRPIYNGKEKEVTITSAWYRDKDNNIQTLPSSSYSIVDNLSVTKATNVSDEYIVTISCNSENYIAGTTGVITKNWSIHELNLNNEKIEIQTNCCGYDGKEKKAADYIEYVRYYYDDNDQSKYITLIPNIDYTVQECIATEEGVYTVNICATEIGNYEGSKSFNFIISPANNSATVTTKNLTYNGELQTLIDSVEATSGATLIQYSIDGGSIWTHTKPKALLAGTYEVKYRIPATKNYSKVEGSVYATIAKRPITSVVTKGTYIYNASSQVVSFDLYDGDTKLEPMIIGVDYKINYGATASETSEQELSITGIGNYQGTVTTKWNIGAQDISNAVIILKNTLTYNENEQTIEIDSVKLNGCDVTYDLINDEEYSNKGTNAGVYTLKIKGTGNYTGTATKNWTINQKKIQVDGKDISVVNGLFTANDLTYNKNPQAALSCKTDVKGIEGKTIYYRLGLDGDWSTEMPKVKDAGIYYVAYKVETNPGVSSNYADFGDVIESPIIVTVKRAKLTSDDFYITPVSVENVTGDKNEVEYNASNQTFKITPPEGITSDDFIILNSDDLTQKNIGTYTIKLTANAKVNGNYTNEILNLNKTFRIVSKDLSSEEAKSQFVIVCRKATYDAEFNSSIDVVDYVQEVKFKNSEHGYAILSKADYTVTHTAITGVGKYDVTITANSEKYKNSITFEDAFEVVGEADVVLEADLYSGTYDGEYHNLLSNVITKAKAAPNQAIDNLTIEYSIDNGATWSETIPTAKDAKTYTINYRVFDRRMYAEKNYAGCVGNIEVTIKPAAITSVDIVQDKFTYNAFKKTLDFSVKSNNLILNSTDYIVTGYTSATDTACVEYENTTDNMRNYINKNENKYKFTVVGKGNFTESITEEWEITKIDIKDAVVLKTLLNPVYNKQPQKPNIMTATVNLLPITFAYEYTDSKDKTKDPTDAGSYTAKLVGTGNFKGYKEITWQIERAAIKVNGSPISISNKPIEKARNNMTYMPSESGGLIQQLVKVRNVDIEGVIDDAPWIEYSFDEETWTNNINEVTKTNAGIYIVYYRLYNSKNYLPHSGKLIVEINKAKLSTNNFKVELSNSMITKGAVNVTYDEYNNAAVDYNGEKVYAKLNGTYKYIDYEDNVVTYNLIRGKDFFVYQYNNQISINSAKDVGIYPLFITTINSGNFEDEEPIIVKLWSINKATPKLNIVDETFEFNGKQQQLLHLDNNKPSNIKDFEKTVYYKISNEPLEYPLEETKYKWTKDLSDLQRKEPGTYYIYYVAPGTENYDDITWNDSKYNEPLVVTLNKCLVTEDKIKLTGDILTEKKSGEDLITQTQTFIITANPSEKLSDDDILYWNDEDVIISQNSNTGAANGTYTLSLTVSNDNKYYTTSINGINTPVSKVWAINGAEFNNEEQLIKDGSYEIKNVVLDDEQHETQNKPVARIETKSFDILTAIATPEDLSEIAKGNKLDIILNSNVVNKEELSININETKILQQVPTFTIGAYVDISLFKQLIKITKDNGGNVVNEEKGELEAIHNVAAGKSIKLTILLPSDLINSSSNIERSYKIVRVHENEDSSLEYEVLDTAYNSQLKTLTFETDRFSTFVVTYKDTITPTYIPKHEIKYEWNKDHKLCTATRYDKNNGKVDVKETRYSTIEVNKSTKKITYTVSFANNYFKKQVYKEALDDNYPNINFLSNDKKNDGKALLINGTINAGYNLVVEELDNDTSDLTIDVNDITNTKSINTYLQTSDGKVIEINNNTYRITINLEEEFKGAEKYYVAIINDDNTTTLIPSEYDENNNSITFETNKLGKFLLLTSESDEEIIIAPISNNHSHTASIAILSVTTGLVALFFVLKKDIFGYGSAVIGTTLLGYIAIKAKCLMCSIVAGIVAAIMIIITIIKRKINK